MYYPSKKEFIKLSKKGNLIPVYREIVADTETPVSAYKKISGSPSFLLESVEGGETIARYSFIGSNPIITLSAIKDKIEITENGKKKTFNGDPLSALEQLLAKYKPVKDNHLPGFHGGFVGFMSYDMIRFIEKLPDEKPDLLNIPDMSFLLTDTILAFDHIKRKIIVISNAFVDKNPEKSYDQAIKNIDKLVKMIEKPLKPKDIELEESKRSRKIKIKSNMTKEAFKKKVNIAKEHIKSGDIIQLVLSQRFETSINVDPFNVYRILRTINPSPYMFYFSFGDLKLIGSSPEIMVRLEKGIATSRPIAGTRPRGKDDQEDESFEKELLSDKKELAEHIMLVDLARNDLGRVSQFGTVNTSSLMTVEKYSHVMHIVSNVTSVLSKGKNAFDLMRASFPAGTVSGAPKVRAMEIIDELETTKRGPYAGAVGYFSFSGDLDSCITIRTILVKGKKAYVQAGAGIVADSIPEKEYEETLNKAKALLKAIELTGK